jgi:2-polyprenyl-3-methyl-5-hydroxy-6-metoxy-1,4-benzoquinol methylase
VLALKLCPNRTDHRLRPVSSLRLLVEHLRNPDRNRHPLVASPGNSEWAALTIAPLAAARHLAERLGRGMLHVVRSRFTLRQRGPAAFASGWWYYTVELAPGVMAQGFYEDDLPMLPRIMLRRSVDVKGADCLDLGSMEGLVPVLLRRAGAARVLATDYDRHCVDKIRAVQAAYEAPFEFKTVGAMDGLHRKIRGSFDLINCSGLLYHVWSPLHVLAGARPLLRRNGLMIVSTMVVLDDGMYAEFNAYGRMQEDLTTFWYPTIPLLEYQLRYLRLEPVDALLEPSSGMKSKVRYVFDKPCGYISVLCRATDAVAGDHWMAQSAALPWGDNKSFTDWDRAARQPVSRLGVPFTPISLGADSVERIPGTAASSQDTHVLHLSDQT